MSAPTQVTYTSASAVHEVVPLTTVFTRPSACLSLLYTSSSAINTAGLSLYVRDSGVPGLGTLSSCYPPYFADHHTATITAVYSPGVCPQGYDGVQTTNLGSKTIAVCCPASFGIDPAFLLCTSTVTTATQVALNPSVTDSITTEFLAGDYYIHVAWASSDLSSFTPVSAPVLARTDGTIIASTSRPTSTSAPSRTTAQTANTSSAQTSSSSGGLSTGAEAGIGVGVAIAGILVLAALVWFLIRKKRRARYTATSQTEMQHQSPRRQTGMQHPSPRQQYGGYGEHTAYHDGDTYAKYADDENPQAAAQEADGTPRRAELPGDATAKPSGR